MKVFIGLFLIIISHNITAQDRDSVELTESGDSSFLFFLPDTGTVFYHYLWNHDVHHVFDDTLISDILDYNPAFSNGNYYGTGGNLGSPAMSLVYHSRQRKSGEVGLNQFDLYRHSASGLRFFKHPSGFTDASYSAGNQQEDGYLKLAFGRTFQHDIRFALDLKKINQRGETYHFQHQNVIQSAFSMGIAKFPENGKYHAGIVFSSNSSDLEENGGIRNESQGAERPFEESVNVTSARTRHDNKEVVFTQALRLKLANPFRSYSVQHDMLYEKAHYKFYDDNLTLFDTNYYQNYLIDFRGLRHYVEQRNFENKLSLKTFKIQPDSMDLGGRKQTDYFEAGLSYSNMDIIHDVHDFQNNLLKLFGRWYISLSDFLSLSTYAHYQLLDYRNDYCIKAKLHLDFGTWADFEVNFINQLYEPTLLQSRFFVSGIEMWDNHFDKTLETGLEAKIEIPKLKLSVSAAYSLLNEYIYFDEFSFPKQSSIPVSVAHFVVDKELKVGVFHFDNRVGFQKSSEDFIRLPSFFSLHQLYYQDYLFKRRLQVHTGIDVKLNSSYVPYGFFPLTGQFHLQNEQETHFFPLVDAYASIKVKTFRFFFKFENLAGFLPDEDLYRFFDQRYFYHFAAYPYPNAVYRFGISWKLSG